MWSVHLSDDMRIDKYTNKQVFVHLVKNTLFFCVILSYILLSILHFINMI